MQNERVTHGLPISGYWEAATPVEVKANTRSAQPVRRCHQTRKWIAASVRQADAVMDQMMVTQLMEAASGQQPVPKNQ